jgi:hypothetical protein
MAATAVESPRFVRRTRLGANEYRRNFHQIDHDVLAAVTSAEADRVTPLMSKIYLRLVSAPSEFWEREGVLYFSAGEVGGRPAKASKVLYECLGVASATAHKALGWMHEQGIVGYFAGKNGAGIRVFLNRAAGSIGVRAAAAGKKILPFAHGSHGNTHGSADEPAFNDSFAVSEVLETDLNPRAPKNGAETMLIGKASSALPRPQAPAACIPHDSEKRELVATPPHAFAVPVREIVERLKGELEHCVREVAARAAAQSAAREMERTREWFETRALPKAVRVAQRETYDMLRRHGAPDGRAGRGSVGPEVGRGAGDHAAAAARPLTAEEVRETAEVCVALLEAQGKSIEVTLSEISSEGGGWLLPEDAPRVRELAEALASGGGAPGTSTGGGR